MTMWTVTQTNRFHAAVAGAGIANWQSYYGENSIDQWMIPFFGASVYDDPAVYAKSSPITFIKQVKTPTLILVGDRDGECPPAQSYEFWHALKTLGVKTEFVIYPNEGHRLGKPEHRKDALARTIGWFNANLKIAGTGSCSVTEVYPGDRLLPVVTISIAMFRTVKEQIDTIFREDPAAKSVIEILLCYPGFHADPAASAGAPAVQGRACR